MPCYFGAGIPGEGAGPVSFGSGLTLCCWRSEASGFQVNRKQFQLTFQYDRQLRRSGNFIFCISTGSVAAKPVIRFSRAAL
jgi:hypothetical protein